MKFVIVEEKIMERWIVMVNIGRPDGVGEFVEMCGAPTKAAAEHIYAALVEREKDHPFHGLAGRGRNPAMVGEIKREVMSQHEGAVLNSDLDGCGMRSAEVYQSAFRPDFS